MGYRWVDPAFALFANGIGLIIFTILTALLPGKGAFILPYLVMFPPFIRRLSHLCFGSVVPARNAPLPSFPSPRPPADL